LAKLNAVIKIYFIIGPQKSHFKKAREMVDFGIKLYTDTIKMPHYHTI